MSGSALVQNSQQKQFETIKTAKSAKAYPHSGQHVSPQKYASLMTQSSISMGKV